MRQTFAAGGSYCSSFIGVFLEDQLLCIKAQALNKSKAPLDVCWVSNWNLDMGLQCLGFPEQPHKVSSELVMGIRGLSCQCFPQGWFPTGTGCEEDTTTLCLLQVLTMGKDQLP